MNLHTVLSKLNKGKNEEKYKGLNTIIISVVLAMLFTVFVTGNLFTVNVQLSKTCFFLVVMMTFIVFMLISYCGFLIQDKFGKKILSGGDVSSFDNISIKTEYIVSFLGFVIFYIPAFLALYPGIFGYDGPIQVRQFLNADVTVTSQHPLLHSALLSGCFKLGEFFFHDYNTGLTIYCVIQCVIMFSIFSYALVWLRKRNVRSAFRVAAFLFYALHPYIQLLNFNTTKDTLYGGFFLLTFLILLELLEKWEIKRAFIFAISAVLMCTFRNQGYYILFFVCVGIFVFCRKKQWKVCLLLLTCAVAGFFLMNPLVSLIGIEAGDSREMLSVPMQQMAAVWNADADGTIVMDDSDRVLLEVLIDPEGLTSYNPYIADPVKSYFNTEVLKENMAVYMKLYLKLGKDNPSIYIKAYYQLSAGFFNPEVHGQYRSLMYSNTFEVINTWGIQRNSLLPSYETYLKAMSEGLLEEIPIIRTVFNPVLSVWLMFMALASCIRRGNWKIVGALLFLLGQWGILMLSPTVLVRYLFPHIICAPVLAALVICPGIILFAGDKRNSCSENIRQM